MKMENHGITKKANLALLENVDNSKLPFNWATDLKSELISLGEYELWQSQDWRRVEKEFTNLQDKMSNHLFSLDVNRILNTTRYPLYRNLSSLSLEEGYLLFECSLSKLKVMSQIRVMGSYHTRIIINGLRYAFDPENNIPYVICMNLTA